MSDDVHPAKVLKRLEQVARKRFGQNFLTQARTADRIARIARVGEGDRVLEIGPGLGLLTRALQRTGAQVRAVELDRDLAAFLETELTDVELVRGDALRLPLDEMAPGEGWHVCANLPYNVATPLLMRLLDTPARFHRLVLMFQREVAHRLIAAPGSRVYGGLSVRVQARAEAHVVMELPPGAFHPQPKVHSAVVALETTTTPDFGGVTAPFFDSVVKAGFSQRRKTLENALKASFGKDVSRAITAATVGAGRRAETLSLDDWRQLARALSEVAE